MPTDRLTPQALPRPSHPTDMHVVIASSYLHLHQAKSQGTYLRINQQSTPQVTPMHRTSLIIRNCGRLSQIASGVQVLSPQTGRRETCGVQNLSGEHQVLNIKCAAQSGSYIHIHNTPLCYHAPRNMSNWKRSAGMPCTSYLPARQTQYAQ